MEIIDTDCMLPEKLAVNNGKTEKTIAQAPHFSMLSANITLNRKERKNELKTVKTHLAHLNLHF